MCDIIEYGNGVPKHISVEFQRNPAYRGTDICIHATEARRSRDSGQIIQLFVGDSGRIKVTVPPQEYVEGVEIVPSETLTIPKYIIENLSSPTYTKYNKDEVCAYCDAYNSNIHKEDCPYRLLKEFL